MKHNQIQTGVRTCLVGALLLLIFTCPVPGVAQPSGGPYGPMPQTYALPTGSGNIYYVAPDGNAGHSGGTIDNPTTLEAAMERVETGDSIIMRGGTYRTGSLMFNQGITIQPYRDEQPVLKGTHVADKWKENPETGVWATSWPSLFPAEPEPWWRREREIEKTPIYRFNNDMVFVDGRLLKTVGSKDEVDGNSYYIDYAAGLVYIGKDPTERLVEITAFDNAFTRTMAECHGKQSDGKGFVLRGIKFAQYAYRAIEIEGYDPEGISHEADHGKDVVGTTIEHCSISFCSRVAGYFRGDHLTIRHCRISDTSTEGIFILNSSDVLLEKNIVMRNNIERITGYYPAAVKIYNQCYRVVCRDNLIIDHPHSNGIWYDVGNVDGIIVDNWFQGIGPRRSASPKKPIGGKARNGFFFEISKGAVCAGNVFVDCERGINIYNSSDVHIYQNTFVNSLACFGRTERGMEADHFGWHPRTGPGVKERDGHIFVNNLLVGDEIYEKLILSIWQSEVLDFPLEKQLKQLDHNVYVRNSGTNAVPLVYCDPATGSGLSNFGTLEELNKHHPHYAAHSKYFTYDNTPVFKSTELGNFELLETFPGFAVATGLPPETAAILNRTGQYVGAYPPGE